MALASLLFVAACERKESVVTASFGANERPYDFFKGFSKSVSANSFVFARWAGKPLFEQSLALLYRQTRLEA